jgi:hypothetical protein
MKRVRAQFRSSPCRVQERAVCSRAAAAKNCRQHQLFFKGTSSSSNSSSQAGQQHNIVRLHVSAAPSVNTMAAANTAATSVFSKPPAFAELQEEATRKLTQVTLTFVPACSRRQPCTCLQLLLLVIWRPSAHPKTVAHDQLQHFSLSLSFARCARSCW